MFTGSGAFSFLFLFLHEVANHWRSSYDLPVFLMYGSHAHFKVISYTYTYVFYNDSLELCRHLYLFYADARFMTLHGESIQGTLDKFFYVHNLFCR